MAEEVEWFVGIDWASQSHQVCLVDARGECLGERAVAHLCVYGINPKQLDRFRDRFTVAGAKDDRRDAQVLGDSLRTDRHAFRRLSNDEPVIVQLREWSRMADDLQQERCRLASRLREQLWRYYPQMLELADDLAADWFLDLWSQASTPARAARLRATTIERFTKKYHLRRWQASEALHLTPAQRRAYVLADNKLALKPRGGDAVPDHRSLREGAWGRLRFIIVTEREIMPERITNVGQIRRAIEGLTDDYPVESWLNGVQTYISIENAGGETGAQLNVTVEPNYTCKPAA